jgi:NADH-quinone oxidoreductase subunit J
MVQAFGGAAPNPGPNAGGVPDVVGLELFTRYILPFEMVGVLLLVALIGALLLARRSAAEQAAAKLVEAEAAPAPKTAPNAAPKQAPRTRRSIRA